jgi:7-carboxy-7-deazaguanine synthase
MKSKNLIFSSMTYLKVQETYQQTIQGEGYWAGLPVDFIRLYGCPVRCYFCDQEYANGGNHLPYSDRTVEELISEIKSDRVVISGGEPFIHKNLDKLVEAIIDSGRRVNIETAGIKWCDLPDNVWITLSPKEHLNMSYRVCQEFFAAANEIKIVIVDGNELDYYAKSLRGNLLKTPWKNLFLQPEWNQRDRTIPIVIELLKKYPTARLSLQTHKYLNLP